MQCFSLENGVFTTPLPLNTPNICSIIHYNKEFSYIPYTGCLLGHILHTDSLTNNEKLFYLLADSLSLINGKNSSKQRAIALSSSTWAEKLGCSKTEIFSLQKSLEEKGYFVIIRDTNKSGKNKRNVIIPTIPDLIFETLCKEPNRFDVDSEDNFNSSSRNSFSTLTPVSTSSSIKDPSQDSFYEHANKRTYLDKTKLFIRLNYKILSLIVASSELSAFAKVVWLNFYSKCYKNHIKSKSYNNDYFAFTCSYLELQNGFSCSKVLISKTIKSLEELSFIKRSRFHVKNDNIDDNLHDKSLWNITVTIPHEFSFKYGENILDIEPQSHAGEEGGISVCDPYISNSDQLYNKDLIINNNDLDSVDHEPKISDDFVSTSSNLSIFFNNNQKVKKNCYNNDLVLSKTMGFDNTTSTSSVLSKSSKFKSLNDFYPLSKEQVDKLNSLSGREFSSNFTNQLLLKLYSRDTSKTFLSENHMMAYMRKALAHEKHQAPLVNHDSFKLAANLSEEDKRGKDIEKYLTEVECSSDTSCPSQLKRKIAGSFDNNLAYQILTKVRFEYEDLTEVIDGSLEDQEILEKEEGGFLIALPKNLLLTEKQQEILENTITSVYGYVDIAYELTENSNIQCSDNLQSKSYLNNQAAIPIYRREEKVRADQDNEKQEEAETSSIWYKIRQELKEELGVEVDKTWFSKLIAEESHDKLELKLYALSNFYRDWINNHYGHIIRRCCKDLGKDLISININC